MEITVIKTEDQYRAYLDEVRALSMRAPQPGTPDADRLELVSRLLEMYEQDRFRLHNPDPVSAIRFAMQQRGMRQKDLAPLLGGKNRASEILSGKRRLTLAMIRSLSRSLKIPAEVLIRDTPGGQGESSQGG
jgi:HTH-type transcriptional regulator/antitoxin HigA